MDDYESILWSILKLNKVEEVVLDTHASPDQCKGHGRSLEGSLKFVPVSKTPLIYEPVVTQIEHPWRSIPPYDVKELLFFVAREHIKYEHKLEKFCDWGWEIDSVNLIVTFRTRNERVSIDSIPDDDEMLYFDDDDPGDHP